MAEQGQWCGIALDSQVQPGLSNPVIVQEQMLALWRGEGGKDPAHESAPHSLPNPVQIWEDRCPHRGMRLSFGYVRGDVLHCIYHSWGFRTNGQCVQIPAHPELPPPKSVRAKPWPAQVCCGIVWTRLERDVDHDCTAPPPDLGCTQQGWQPVRSLYVNASATQLEAALTTFDFGADFGTAARLTRPQDRVLLLALEGGLNKGLELLLALQPVSDSHSGLHMVARERTTNQPGDADNTAQPCSIQTRIKLAQRLQRLRREVEQQQ